MLSKKANGKPTNATIANATTARQDKALQPPGDPASYHTGPETAADQMIRENTPENLSQNKPGPSNGIPPTGVKSSKTVFRETIAQQPAKIPANKRHTLKLASAVV